MTHTMYPTIECQGQSHISGKPPRREFSTTGTKFVGVPDIQEQIILKYINTRLKNQIVKESLICNQNLMTQ